MYIKSRKWQRVSPCCSTWRRRWSKVWHYLSLLGSALTISFPADGTVRRKRALTNEAAPAAPPSSKLLRQYVQSCQSVSNVSSLMMRIGMCKVYFLLPTQFCYRSPSTPASTESNATCVLSLFGSQAHSMSAFPTGKRFLLRFSSTFSLLNNFYL